MRIAINRRTMLTLLAAWPLARVLPARAATATIQVYTNPACGCCTGWTKHLQTAGYAVNVTHVDDPGTVRRRFGMPDRFGSCHTALVDGYVLEGHVPAADIGRLLAEHPTALGLAVPGMPAGSPGMEGSGVQPFDVVLVDGRGSARVYAHHAAS